MPFDHVDVRRGQPAAGQRRADDPLLRRPVRCGQSVGGAVLIHRGAPHQRQHRMPQPPRIGQALHHQDARAFRPCGAVGGPGVHLAPAVGGQRPLAAELDKRRRGGHYRHAADQRQVALARPQRLRRQMQCHQRRRTRRIHRHRRAFQAQHVRHPARGHAQRRAGEPVALQLAFHLAPVAGVDHAGEHARRRTSQRGRVNSGPLQALPTTAPASTAAADPSPAPRWARRRRIRHRNRRRRARNEPCRTYILPGGVGVRVEQPRHVPAPVRGKVRHRVAALNHHLPQASGESTPPGYRHAIPTTATGSDSLPSSSDSRRRVRRRSAVRRFR